MVGKNCNGTVRIGARVVFGKRCLVGASASFFCVTTIRLHPAPRGPKNTPSPPKANTSGRDGGAGGRMTFLGWGGCCGCCRDNSSGVRGPLAACMLQRRVCCSARGSCCLRACSAHVCRTAHSCSLPPGHTGALHWFHILLFGGSTQG